jgi:hypothetical protein
VTLHRRRFRRGAYQEDTERERVEGIVRRTAQRCGVTGRDRYRATSAEPTAPDTDPQTGLTESNARDATQLRLL